MALRKLTVLAVVLAVLVLYVHAQEEEPQTQDAEVRCKKREVYSECGNKCEEAQCEPDDDQNCTTVCVPGCYCKEGTARNKFGNCVPKYMCMYKNYIG